MQSNQNLDNNDSDLDLNSDENNDNYIINTKVCKRLSKELGLNDFPEFDEEINWQPPNINGLINSDVIIPSYYKLHQNPSKIFNLDYYEIIKDDIRNCRPLNKYQLLFIKDLSHDCKLDLICIYNECIKMFSEILQNDESLK